MLRILTWKVLALTLAETELPDLQEWEVRAMAALVWQRLPRVLRLVVGEERLESAAVGQWRSMVVWYRRERPRENSCLFGAQETQIASRRA
jgi:hypothetical protein